MTGLHAQIAVWLIQAARDTTYVKAVAVERGWLAQATDVATLLITVALLAMTVVVIPAAWRFRKTTLKADALLDRVQADMAPVVRHATAISDNIAHVTATIRGDVERINTTVTAANERIHEAV